MRLSVRDIRIVPLDKKKHDRTSFCSGSDPLDHYFKNQASQDAKRRLNSCFLAVDIAEENVFGYYTISSAQILFDDLPENISKKLPRYPIPAARIGRLAVDHRHQRKEIGSIMLADALKLALDSEIASYAVTVDAKDKTAASFYIHHGFIPFQSNPLLLFLPIGTIKML
ncbi:MAG: GNAT family N-acetyltransferase [Chlorobiales bacterium]|nr:GNAT family N-acetyltransferase [Chlorobiales bacterium]